MTTGVSRVHTDFLRKQIHVDICHIFYFPYSAANISLYIRLCDLDPTQFSHVIQFIVLHDHMIGIVF